MRKGSGGHPLSVWPMRPRRAPLLPRKPLASYPVAEMSAAAQIVQPSKVHLPKHDIDMPSRLAASRIRPPQCWLRVTMRGQSLDLQLQDALFDGAANHKTNDSDGLGLAQAVDAVCSLCLRRGSKSMELKHNFLCYNLCLRAYSTTKYGHFIQFWAWRLAQQLTVTASTQTHTFHPPRFPTLPSILSSRGACSPAMVTHLHRRVPPGVQQHDVGSSGQVQCHAARFQAHEEHAHLEVGPSCGGEVSWERGQSTGRQAGRQARIDPYRIQSSDVEWLQWPCAIRTNSPKKQT
jgi:hypothetical protein